MQDAKEEIRARLDIEDVIGEYVQLKRAGRNLKGLSPFTNEKTPSFIVSPEKNIWHDFSSNKGGDIFSFIMEVEGLDFKGALEYLGRKAGVEIQAYSQKPSGYTNIKKQVMDLNALASKYYLHTLANNEQALNYVISERKINKATIKSFGIGYSPSTGKALVSFMEKRGHSINDIKKAGLTNQYGGDLFRGRMTIALTDPTGQVIGFTARQLADQTGGPKYLNTPQTAAYDKSRHVFGLFQAKEAIRKEGFVVVVEGNMDVIASHQVGVSNVVATAGTAMTEMHLKTLARFTDKVKLAYDNDDAGLLATERAIALASNLKIDLFIVQLPPGFKDPDELIQKQPQLWSQAVTKEVPAIDWVILEYQQKEDLTTAIGRRNFVAAAAKLIKQLEDKVVKDYYIDLIARKSGVPKPVLEEKFKKVDEKPRTYKKVKPAKTATKSGVASDSHIVDSLLGLLVLMGRGVELLPANIIAVLQTAQQRELFDYILKKQQFTQDELFTELQNIETYVKIITLKAEERYLSWSDEAREKELFELVHRLMKKERKQKKEELLKQLKDAEFLGDESKARSIRAELNAHIKENNGR